MSNALILGAIAMAAPLSVAIVRQRFEDAVVSLIVCSCFFLGAQQAAWLDAAASVY